MTNNLKTAQTLPHKTESEIIDFIKKVVKEDTNGVAMFPIEYIRVLLDILNHQKKEIKHCQKHLNRLQAWKNRFWLSILKSEDSGYYRKNGLQGKRFFGYSVRLRVLGREII